MLDSVLWNCLAGRKYNTIRSSSRENPSDSDDDDDDDDDEEVEVVVAEEVETESSGEERMDMESGVFMALAMWW